MIDQLATELLMLTEQEKQIKARKAEVREQLIGMVPVWMLNQVDGLPAELIGETHRVDFRHQLNMVYKPAILDGVLTETQKRDCKAPVWQKFVTASLI